MYKNLLIIGSQFRFRHGFIYLKSYYPGDHTSLNDSNLLLAVILFLDLLLMAWLKSIAFSLDLG